MDSKLKILCVEDEIMLLEDLREELEEAGYTVATAKNGVKAIAEIKTAKPDLILCDMMMPEMDGPQLLKYVRQELPSMTSVPFIFLTARATRDDIIAGKRMGGDDYLTKPIDYDLLLATVETRLRQVKLIEEQNRNRLKKIHSQFLKLKENQGRIRVAMVASKPQLVAPINSALLELGCEVRVVSEDALIKRRFEPARDEIIFLVYSKTIHYYLEHLRQVKPSNASSRHIILGPSEMNEGTKQGILESGVDELIDYPYKPVDVFKQIVTYMRGANRPEAQAAHTS